MPRVRACMHNLHGPTLPAHSDLTCKHMHASAACARVLACASWCRAVHMSSLMSSVITAYCHLSNRSHAQEVPLVMSRAAAQPGAEKCMFVELQHSLNDTCFDGDSGVIGRVATSGPTGTSLDLKGVQRAGCHKAAFDTNDRATQRPH